MMSKSIRIKLSLYEIRGLALAVEQLYAQDGDDCEVSLMYNLETKELDFSTLLDETEEK
jgi:hypothetical protein